MSEYDWPGNIRELRNVVERAIVMEDGPILRVHGALGEGGSPAEPLAGGESSRGLAAELGQSSLQDLLREYKKSLIEIALKKSNGNQRRAAELLGLHRPSLTRMIKDLGLRDDS
jgi:two-component system response regulator AtoC